MLATDDKVQLSDSEVSQAIPQLPAPGRAAVPSPDLAGDLLARAFERILRWPCPQCGRPFPCPCDDPQPKQTVELTHFQPYEGQAGAAQQLL